MQRERIYFNTTHHKPSKTPYYLIPESETVIFNTITNITTLRFVTRLVYFTELLCVPNDLTVGHAEKHQSTSCWIAVSRVMAL